jgi:hypothetical protein
VPIRFYFALAIIFFGLGEEKNRAPIKAKKTIAIKPG